MDAFLTKQDGSLPDVNNLKATDTGQYAKVAVDRQSRAMLVRGYGEADRPNEEAVGTQVATVGNTAQTLAEMGVTLNAATQRLLITVENADVRFDPTGKNVSNSVGQPIWGGDRVVIGRSEALSGKWIRQASTSATLQITEYL